jgi:hypothetical protein
MLQRPSTTPARNRRWISVAGWPHRSSNIIVGRWDAPLPAPGGWRGWRPRPCGSAIGGRRSKTAPCSEAASIGNGPPAQPLPKPTQHAAGDPAIIHGSASRPRINKRQIGTLSVRDFLNCDPLDERIFLAVEPAISGEARSVLRSSSWTRFTNAVSVSCLLVLLRSMNGLICLADCSEVRTLTSSSVAR